LLEYATLSWNVVGSVVVLWAAVAWILAWLATQGPMRVVVLRWRFRSGRIL
jgi:hypothetical protein